MHRVLRESMLGEFPSLFQGTQSTVTAFRVKYCSGRTWEESNSQKEDQGPQDCLLTVEWWTGFEWKALKLSGKKLYTNLGKFQSVGGLKCGGMERKLERRKSSKTHYSSFAVSSPRAIKASSLPPVVSNFFGWFSKPLQLTLVSADPYDSRLLPASPVHPVSSVLCAFPLWALSFILLLHPSKYLPPTPPVLTVITWIEHPLGTGPGAPF